LTIKKTTRPIQSGGWNRSFIGLTSWEEEEEEKDTGLLNAAISRYAMYSSSLNFCRR